MSAFDADDPFTAQIRQAQQQQQQKAAPTSAPLKKPPKWLRRPCGATFGVCKYIILVVYLTLKQLHCSVTFHQLPFLIKTTLVLTSIQCTLLNYVYICSD